MKVLLVEDGQGVGGNVDAGESEELMRGDPALYGEGVGLWSRSRLGSAPARVGVLLNAVAEMARAARAAQRHAVMCGLGGSRLERALEVQAEAAERLERRVKPELFF